MTSSEYRRGQWIGPDRVAGSATHDQGARCASASSAMAILRMRNFSDALIIV
jgi:hypothetical protein